MTGDHWIVNSDTTKEQFLQHVRDLYQEHKYVTFKWSTGKQRSDQQRKAIEVYCRELAKALNAAGLDQRAVLAQMKDGVEIPWSQELCKEVLFKQVEKAVLGKDSTTKLEREEVSKVYDVLNRWTSEKLGVSVPFPERQE